MLLDEEARRDRGGPRPQRPAGCGWTGRRRSRRACRSPERGRRLPGTRACAPCCRRTRGPSCSPRAWPRSRPRRRGASRGARAGGPGRPERERNALKSSRASFEGREEIGAAEHALELGAPSAVVERLDPRDVGSPGTFRPGSGGRRALAICGRCVIVTTWARSARRRSVLGDGARCRAADARVDLVEDHRLAPADGGDRERDARELAAGRRLGDGRRTAGRRSAGSGTRLRRLRSRPDRARRSSTRNSPSPRPTPRELLGDGRGERLGGRSRRAAQCGVHAVDLGLGGASASAAARTGSWPSVERPSSRRASAAALEQLLVASAAPVAPPGRRSARARLDLLEPAGIGLQRGQEGPQLARGLAQVSSAVAERRRPPPRAPARAARAARPRAPPRRRGRVRRRRPRARARRARPRRPRRARSTCRSRSRSARSSSSRPGVEPVVSVGELRSSSTRASAAAASRVSSSWARRAAASSRQACRGRARASPSPQTRRARRAGSSGRESRRCSNWPLIAISASAAAATSSRAAARPQA